MKKVMLFIFLIYTIKFLAQTEEVPFYSYNNVAQHVGEVADPNVILPPAWVFGVVYGGYTNQEQTIERIKKILAHNYPIDAYWIDSWFWDWQNQGKGPKKYIDFVGDTISYPNRKAMWDFMEDNHIKSGFWVWDCILKTGNEEVYSEFDSLGYFSSKYLNKNPWHNTGTTTAMFAEESEHPGTWCGNIDFENPEAIAFFKSKMKHFFDEGADYLKLDRTSSLSVVKTIFEMSQEFGKESKGRGYMLSHTGGTDTEAYKQYPAKYTDDSRSDWTIESPTKEFNTWVPKIGLKENIALFTDPASETSKIPFLTNDTGGFDMGLTDKVDEELYIRWVQFSMFTPLMQVFSQPENITGNMAYNYSERADAIFRKYAQLRMELFPYIYSYALNNRVQGEKIIRPITGLLHQYFFGNELLVAPVYEQGATKRSVSLPEGEWVNFWTDEKLEGNQKIIINAPVERTPLLVRQGAIIPMRPYVRAIKLGTKDTINLHVYPGKDSKFTLYEDDGESKDYLNNIFSETTIELIQIDNDSFKLHIHPPKGSYLGMPKARKWQVIIHSDNNYSRAIIEGKSYNLSKNDNLLNTGYIMSKGQLLEIIFK